MAIKSHVKMALYQLHLKLQHVLYAKVVDMQTKNRLHAVYVSQAFFAEMVFATHAWLVFMLLGQDLGFVCSASMAHIALLTGQVAFHAKQAHFAFMAFLKHASLHSIALHQRQQRVYCACLALIQMQMSHNACLASQASFA